MFDVRARGQAPRDVAELRQQHPQDPELQLMVDQCGLVLALARAGRAPVLVLQRFEAHQRREIEAVDLADVLL